MVTRNVEIRQRSHPLSITFLIDTANSFNCDIYIKCGTTRINAKSYEDVQSGLVTKDKNLLFYFNGMDELEAESRIQQIFQP